MSIEEIVTDKPRRELIVNMPRTLYRSTPGLNPSSLASGLMSGGEIDPRAIRDAYEQADTSRQTAAQDRMDRGTLAHLALLQPERMAAEIAVWGGIVRRGSAWESFEADNAGKLIIRMDDYEWVMAAVNQMRAQPLVANLLVDIEPEVALFTSVESCGLTIQRRGQVDIIQRHGDINRIVDIKTTEAGIDQRSTERTIREMNYREKMAVYRRAVADLTDTDPDEWQCWNLFLSLGTRIGVRAVKLTSGALEFGEERMKHAFKATAECLASGRWPMFAKSDVMDVTLWEIEAMEGKVHIE